MTPPNNNKNKTDSCYKPDDWRLSKSEKRLVAINITKSHMSKKEQEKTTNIMQDQEIDYFKDNKEDKLVFYDDTGENDVETATEDAPTYTFHKDKTKNLDAFETVVDYSDKTRLHSSDKSDSDMIAVEPKDASRVRKVQIVLRTKWLRFLQWFKWKF